MLSETMTARSDGAPSARTTRRNTAAAPEEPYRRTSMRVKKRNGSSEPVDVDKIVRAVGRCCVGLVDVDPLRIATKTICGLYDGATTRELDQLSIQTAAGLIVEEPQYAKLSARLLGTYIEKEVRNQEIHAFSQSVTVGHRLGLVNDRLRTFVVDNARKLNDSIAPERDRELEYFGLRTLYDRYLIKHPTTRLVIETPQQFFMRIACALSESVPEALELYRLLSTLEYLPSSPTLFNSGTRHEQLSSCFLLDSPEDHLEHIYQRYSDVALLSKFSGGIGMAYHRVRSRGSLIESTNGHSNGIVPWLKTLDASVAAVNQGGKRKGACCVYLEPWHADVEEFLELRNNTGDEASRTHNLNLASWVPDLFMRRVEADGTWSLFDPKVVPEMPDLYGEAFERRYEEAEALGLAAKTVKARDLYARMMRTLAQTGNGWMTFKDKSNRACNQTALPGRVVHLSNLCTEILEVTSAGETAVCNLGSINLGRHTVSGPGGSVAFDIEKFLLNLICFAACIEGLFFFGAFAYVYFLRSRGLLHGLAAGTNWVFRDESAHMAFAFEVVQTVRREEPELFDAELSSAVFEMIEEAISCETQFTEDLLGAGVVGISVGDVRRYLELCADQRLATLGLPRRYNARNPFSFMDLQDVQEVTNFFERRVSAYQVGVSGEVDLDAAF